ncbi:hypothetical protein LSAT2_031546 [Lamellibrachia satsuma]|nr:hypothetical protein LSAT2_031546 [Lamellibrachia satsuma]
MENKNLYQPRQTDDLGYWSVEGSRIEMSTVRLTGQLTGRYYRRPDSELNTEKQVLNGSAPAYKSNMVKKTSTNSLITINGEVTSRCDAAADRNVLIIAEHVNYIITMSVLRELLKYASQTRSKNTVTGRTNEHGDRRRGQSD